MWTTWMALHDISTQIDSFQDPCSDFQQNIRNWLLSRPLCFTVGIDSFQDPCSDYFSKMSEIDSFQDPCVSYHWNWLLSRPCAAFYIWQNVTIWLISRPLCFTSDQLLSRPLPFLDTNQQNRHPWQWTVSNITQFSHFKTLKLDLYSVSISMGDYLQNLHGRLSSGTFIKTLYTVNFGPFWENKEEDTSHANSQLSSSR